LPAYSWVALNTLDDVVYLQKRLWDSFEGFQPAFAAKVQDMAITRECRYVGAICSLDNSRTGDLHQAAGGSLIAATLAVLLRYENRHDGSHLDTSGTAKEFLISGSPIVLRGFAMSVTLRVSDKQNRYKKLYASILSQQPVAMSVAQGKPVFVRMGPITIPLDAMPQRLCVINACGETNIPEFREALVSMLHADALVERSNYQPGPQFIENLHRVRRELVDHELLRPVIDPTVGFRRAYEASLPTKTTDSPVLPPPRDTEPADNRKVRKVSTETTGQRRRKR